MPTSFLKSIGLTALIALQIKSIDIGLSYVKNMGLPKETFILIGVGVLLMGIFIYSIWIKRFVVKNKPLYGQ